MVATLKDMKLTIATTTFGNRVAYAASMVRGLGVAESEPSSHAAVQEVFDLVKEIKRHKVMKAAVKKAA
jgi:hypothetical protein